MMTFLTNNDKLQGQSYGFSDDGLVSLLQYPLSNSGFTSSGPITDVSNIVSDNETSPLSFHMPFDDPTMEPVPLGPSCSPLDCSSADHVTSLLSLLDPVLDIVGSSSNKRSFMVHSEEENDFEMPSKRQRIMAPAGRQSPPAEECTARFRPYQEKQWRAQFQKLIEFKLLNGHCLVPHSYPEDPVLARWVKRQRYQYKKFKDGNPTSTMTTRRIQELEAVGFVWHSHHAAWQEKLNELRQFKQQTGHCNVPSHYPENVSLSTWVKCQRRQYKLHVNGTSSNMTIERFHDLESLGFVFDVSKK